MARSLFCLLLFCISCATTKPKEQVFRVLRPLELSELKFYLQPWQNTVIYINNQKQWVVPQQVNKTIGYFVIPVGDISGAITLSFHHLDFNSLEIELGELDYQRMLSHDPPLYQLIPQGVPVRLLHRWQVGRQPKSVTFLDSRRVILPYLDDTKIEVLDIFTGERVKLMLPWEIASKESFVESVIINSRNEFWVSQMSTHSVHGFSLLDLTYRGTVVTSGKWSKVLCWDEGRKLLYVSNWQSKDISVVDLEVMRERRKISLPGVPRGMVLSEDGKYLYVVHFGSETDTDNKGRLLKLDPDTGSIVWDKIFNGSLRHIVGKANKFYFSNMSLGYVAVLERDEVVSQLPTFDKPNTIVLDKEGCHLYVSSRGPNHPESYLKAGLVFGKLQVFDVVNYRLLAQWEAGDQPTGLALSPDGHYLVSSDFLNHAVRVYELLPPLRPSH